MQQIGYVDMHTMFWCGGCGRLVTTENNAPIWNEPDIIEKHTKLIIEKSEV
jgi:hypothetical protein